MWTKAAEHLICITFSVVKNLWGQKGEHTLKFKQSQQIGFPR